MGTCISKCRPSPSPTKHPCLPQDKLVISQSPCVASSTCISHGHQNQSSTTSSSSSSSSAASAASSFCPSACSSSSLSKDGYSRGEPLRSSARRHPHIIVLDPENGTQWPSGAKPARFSAQAVATSSNPGTPARSQPPKRARSTSPAPLVRQKSFRSSEQSSAVPTRGPRHSSPFKSTMQGTVARPRPPFLVGHGHRSFGPGREFQHSMVAFSNSNLASPSPGHRYGAGDGSGRPKWMREESPAHEIVLTVDEKPTSGHVVTRKERLQLSSPCDAGHRAARLKRRETSVHPVRAQVEQERSENVIPMEDMNNPLISLDCFIFL